jgi:predicted metal-dependent hydrolase
MVTSPPMADIDFAAHFLEGVERFNTLRFWDAHESWEELWLEAETDLDQFLQGLIQLAAAYHHVRRGTLPGGVRLFDAALRRLEAFPPRHCGIDRSDATSAAADHRRRAAAAVASGSKAAVLRDDEYPKLQLIDPAEAAMPPVTPW